MPRKMSGMAMSMIDESIVASIVPTVVLDNANHLYESERGFPMTPALGPVPSRAVPGCVPAGLPFVPLAEAAGTSVISWVGPAAAGCQIEAVGFAVADHQHRHGRVTDELLGDGAHDQTAHQPVAATPNHDGPRLVLAGRGDQLCRRVTAGDPEPPVNLPPGQDGGG